MRSLVLALTVVLGGCARSHLIVDERDAGAAPRDAETRDAFVPRPLAECGDAFAIDADGLAEIALPDECGFAEPLHRIDFDVTVEGDVERYCWDAIWTGTAPRTARVETEEPHLGAYTYGDADFFAVDLRAIMHDGTIHGARAQYSNRGRGSGVEIERADGVVLAIVGGGYAAHDGLHLESGFHPVRALMMAEDFVGDGAQNAVVWIAKTPTNRVGVTFSLRGDVRSEQIALPNGRVLLASSAGSSFQAWGAAVAGSVATIVRYDRALEWPILRSSFDLGEEPDSIGIRGDLLLATFDGELRAWKIDGVPAAVAPAEVVSRLVPGPEGAIAELEDGRIAVPIVGAGIEGYRAIHVIDRRLGRVLTASADLFIGENGFQRRALDAGPTFSFWGGPMGGGTISAARIDSLAGTSYVAMRIGSTTAIFESEELSRDCD
jgi:hypothetical protein